VRLFAILLCGFLCFFAYWTDNTTVSVDDKFHIVLDAGHGGRDNGAIAADGTTEAGINLALVRALEQELIARNFAVTLTRTDSESLASPYAANKKVDDMAKRRAKIRDLEPDLVISIHQNSYPSPAVRGLQCFYANETEQSKDYADAIQKQFNDSNLPIYKTPKPTDFNLCEHSPCPAVLIECGFLSNTTELKLLKTAEYRQILAWNIAAAITIKCNSASN
jgi:N-acetylmuramoyl-L-alanine amidase